ncbi:MAG: phosphate/phosphite/phosphonate ABC transporter substrate-binding protein [Asticcacaulis sp.]|nr:phosphate/phosphite/phosphonate ABC transporter substrate-binding protein [Asticcacaulis sp.]
MPEAFPLNWIKGAAAVVLGVATLGLASCEKKAETTSTPGVINFSVLSVQKSQDLDKTWQPILSDMQKQTGLKVKPFYSSSYTSLIEAMRFKQAEAGFFSTSSGSEAVKRAGAEVFASNTNPDGTDTYLSVIIVRKDSNVTLDDVLKCNHKLNFGLGDVKSASGSIAPKAYLFIPNKVDPDNCFRAVKVANHGANIEGVLTGTLDAATNNSDALDDLSRTPEGRAKLAQLKIIWHSPPMRKGVLVYRSDLDPATKEKIRSFFLSYGVGNSPEAERQRANLTAFEWGPAQPADVSYLLPTQLMEAQVNLFEAQKSGDKTAAAAAQADIDAATAGLAKLDAKTAPQAPADAPASQ